jgi:hypothetical protein
MNELGPQIRAAARSIVADLLANFNVANLPREWTVVDFPSTREQVVDVAFGAVLEQAMIMAVASEKNGAERILVLCVLIDVFELPEAQADSERVRSIWRGAVGEDASRAGVKPPCSGQQPGEGSCLQGSSGQTRIASH